MKPGRELDALVAEKVMGLHEYEIPAQGGMGLPDCEVCGSGRDHEYPAYSTDIAAAWEVVSAVCLLPKLGFCLVQFQKGKWCAGWRDSGSYEFDFVYSATKETAPHAICLAALKAVGGEVPEGE